MPKMRALWRAPLAFEVIGFIETKFGIAVEDEEMLAENLESIDCIARYVLRKQVIQFAGGRRAEAH